MALSLENSQRLEQIRAKILRGDVTREEEMEAFTVLRQDRVSASTASTKARTAKAEAARPVDTKALLANIGQQVFTKPGASAPSTPAPAGTFKL